MKINLKKLAFYMIAVAVLTVTATAAHATGGNWSELGIWCGDSSDARGAFLASHFRARVIDNRMSIPVYDVMLDFKPGSKELFPFNVDTADVAAGVPSNVIITGRYNGYNEEKIMDFSGATRNALVRFTCSPSLTQPADGRFYAVDGIVNWTPRTNRSFDRICIVWDATMRAKVYLGASFSELAETVGMDSSLHGYTTE